MITEIKDVRVAGKGTGLGAVLGGVAGLVVGNQIGDGNGQTIAKVAGAAGGAYVGNRVEKRARGTMTYEVTVRMDNGGTRTVTLDHEPGFSNGAAVRVVDNDTIVAR